MSMMVRSCWMEGESVRQCEAGVGQQSSPRLPQTKPKTVVERRCFYHHPNGKMDGQEEREEREEIESERASSRGW